MRPCDSGVSPRGVSWCAYVCSVYAEHQRSVHSGGVMRCASVLEWKGIIKSEFDSRGRQTPTFLPLDTQGGKTCVHKSRTVVLSQLCNAMSDTSWSL